MIEDLALSFGDRVIFEELGLRVSEGDRIGLIGPNGSGKTTLLRVIAGEQEFDSGTIKRARGTRIGYLPQDIAVAGGKPLLEFVLSSVPGRSDLDDQLAECEAELERASNVDAPDQDVLMALAERIADIHERIDHFEQFFSEHEAVRILAGLGFETADHQRDVAELSGGWQMRAILAGLLFQQPDLLLLDEPTNHLDLPSVAWFGDFLRRYKRSFFLISHDREFLNEQIARVVSLELEGVRSYAGNFDNYVEQRAEEEQILDNQAKNLERKREHLQRFVDRFRYKASKATSVQSRVKQLEKMQDVELYQKRRVMRFSFPPTERTVGEVVRIDHLRKAYGDNVVFSDLSLSVRRGEKIGIIGVNGAGKTTLLKMIAAELAPDAGTINIGTNAKVGYYAQHHADTLDARSTVYDEVSHANPDATPGRVRSILGAFLFSGDDVDKPVRVLSGGERARVALARLMVNPGNLLLMDEPTNHLDLQSSESLAQSLNTFDGTLVFVSHNRSLIRSLASTIWNAEDGDVEEYTGTLDEYMHSSRLRREAMARSAGLADATDADPAAGRIMPGSAAPSRAAARRAGATKDRSGDDVGATALSGAAESEAEKHGGNGADSDRGRGKGSREEERARKRREAELRNKRYKVLGPLRKRVTELEERITALETEQAGRSQELSDPAVYADEQRRDRLLSEFQRGQSKLDELTGRWEVVQEELDRAEAEIAAKEADLHN
ncbi:MAG: ABC-F family ATP-binding cassette domain-containing protein [Proteobacteria bacterium]|nr:ABC-F family ATP-binding cassette domain-containing protein [Pseudomonadota bacterium]